MSIVAVPLLLSTSVTLTGSSFLIKKLLKLLKFVELKNKFDYLFNITMEIPSSGF